MSAERTMEVGFCPKTCTCTWQIWKKLFSLIVRDIFGVQKSVPEVQLLWFCGDIRLSQKLFKYVRISKI